jgi:hypothetical protein
LNLRTGNSYFLDVSYYVLDVELSGDYLFVNQGHDGFQVWDISNLPDYVVVFNDSVYRYWGCMASRDSLLLEIYRDNGYTYKFWNIADPAQPYVITEGSLPHQAYYNLHDIAMTEQYVIGFSSAVLYRYRYDPTGSLTYEDVLSLEYAYYDDYRTSDSLIYLLYPHRVDIISIDDFMLQQPITVNHMNYYGNYALAIEVFEEYVYLMLRDKGIRIYQRRVR